MGELISAGAAQSGFEQGLGLVSGLASVVALGLFALFQRDQENNDDDDSNPGGGLMQPIA